MFFSAIGNHIRFWPGLGGDGRRRVAVSCYDGRTNMRRISNLNVLIQSPFSIETNDHVPFEKSTHNREAATVLREIKDHHGLQSMLGEWKLFPSGRTDG